MGTSQNGWSQLSKGQCSTFVLNGVTVYCNNRDVATVIEHVMRRKNNEVERCIVTSSWRSTSFSGGISNSNHTSATGFDDGGNGRHPYERALLKKGLRYHSGYTAVQEATLRRIARETTDDAGRSVIRLGIDFQVGYRDSMHTEIAPVSAAQVAQAARKIRGGAAPKPKPTSSGTKYTALEVDGVAGPATVKNVQRWAGATADGSWDVNTEHAIQYKCNLHPGPWGPISKKAFQKAFGATQDGVLGPKTWVAVQRWFNAHRNG